MLFLVLIIMPGVIFGAPPGTAPTYYVGLAISPSKIFPAKESLCWTKKTVSNGSRIYCMKVKPELFPSHRFVSKFANSDEDFFRRGIQSTTGSLKLFHTSLHTDDSIAKEIDYMLNKGWIPCLEFDEAGYIQRENSKMPGYYDGRYWTLWKLPMFGCTDPSRVLSEIQECKKTYPNAFIRCVAFDNQNQGQCMAFIIQKPTAATSA